MASSVTDGVHGYVNFGKEHLIAGAAPEVVVDGGCELVLVREKSMQQPREISAPLACGRIRRRREGRGLMGEKIRRRGGFGDGRAIHIAMLRTDPSGRRGALECSWPPPRP